MNDSFLQDDMISYALVSSSLDLASLFLICKASSQDDAARRYNIILSCCLVVFLLLGVSSNDALFVNIYYVEERFWSGSRGTQPWRVNARQYNMVLSCIASYCLVAARPYTKTI